MERHRKKWSVDGEAIQRLAVLKGIQKVDTQINRNFRELVSANSARLNKPIANSKVGIPVVFSDTGWHFNL